MKLKLNNGIHDIINEVYHKSEGLSRSALWEFKKSPWHYWNKYLNPNAIPEKPSASMKLGDLLHTLVLEPRTFCEKYTLEPVLLNIPKVGLLKDLGRDEYEIQKKLREHALLGNQILLDKFAKETICGRETVSREIYEEAKAMAERVLSDDTAAALFRDVKIENSIYFNHQTTGIQCKSRMDAWTGSLITDLKTCKDASYRAFQSSAYNYGYYLQAGMMKVALASIGIELEKFVFYCVEKSQGYPCVYYLLDDEALDYGVNQFNNLMEKFARCLESNKWASYEPQTLYLPNYSKYED